MPRSKRPRRKRQAPQGAKQVRSFAGSKAATEGYYHRLEKRLKVLGVRDAEVEHRLGQVRDGLVDMFEKVVEMHALNVELNRQLLTTRKAAIESQDVGERLARELREARVDNPGVLLETERSRANGLEEELAEVSGVLSRLRRYLEAVDGGHVGNCCQCVDRVRSIVEGKNDGTLQRSELQRGDRVDQDNDTEGRSEANPAERPAGEDIRTDE